MWICKCTIERCCIDGYMKPVLHKLNIIREESVAKPAYAAKVIVYQIVFYFLKLILQVLAGGV